MATKDEIIQKFNERVAALELQVKRAEAARDCRNAANKYQTYHTMQSSAETFTFALKTPGGRVEMLWGIYDNPEGILRWKINEGFGSTPRTVMRTPGNQHAMGTPIMEVAADGKTARGMWLMFAYYGVCWAAGQFAMDFIQEDGQWKIWNYNTGGLIYSPFEKGWHRENREVLTNMIAGDKTRPEGTRADRAPSWPWMWGPEEYFQNIPPVPEAYETWDDDLACIPGPGKSWTVKKFE